MSNLENPQGKGPEKKSWFVKNLPPLTACFAILRDFISNKPKAALNESTPKSTTPLTEDTVPAPTPTEPPVTPASETLPTISPDAPKAKAPVSFSDSQPEDILPQPSQITIETAATSNPDKSLEFSTSASEAAPQQPAQQNAEPEIIPQRPDQTQENMKRIVENIKNYVAALIEHTNSLLKTEREKATDMETVLAFQQQAISYLNDLVNSNEWLSLEPSKQNEAVRLKILDAWNKKCPAFEERKGNARTIERGLPAFKSHAGKQEGKNFYTHLSNKNANVQQYFQSMMEDFIEKLLPENKISDLKGDLEKLESLQNSDFSTVKEEDLAFYSLFPRLDEKMPGYLEKLKNHPAYNSYVLPLIKLGLQNASIYRFSAFFLPINEESQNLDNLNDYIKIDVRTEKDNPNKLSISVVIPNESSKQVVDDTKTKIRTEIVKHATIFNLSVSLDKDSNSSTKQPFNWKVEHQATQTTIFAGSATEGKYNDSRGIQILDEKLSSTAFESLSAILSKHGYQI